MTTSDGMHDTNNSQGGRGGTKSVKTPCEHHHMTHHPTVRDEGQSDRLSVMATAMASFMGQMRVHGSVVVVVVGVVNCHGRVMAHGLTPTCGVNVMMMMMMMMMMAVCYHEPGQMPSICGDGFPQY